MKNNIKISVNNKFFAFFLLLLGLNALSAINEDVIFLQTTKILIVPVFLMYFINKNNHINIACASFFIFFFLGDSASVLFTNDTFIKASSVMYFLSYMSLLIMIAPKFKFIEMNPVVGLYLFIILIVNTYFLYVLYGVLNAMIPDSLEVFLFGVKSVSLIVLILISFGVYLNAESKLSILFLMVAICFGLSDILNYISSYYVYDWSFVMLDRVLHLSGVAIFLNYIIENNKTISQTVSKEVFSVKSEFV